MASEHTVADVRLRLRDDDRDDQPSAPAPTATPCQRSIPPAAQTRQRMAPGRTCATRTPPHSAHGGR